MPGLDGTVWYSVPLITLQVNLSMMFAANHLTGAKPGLNQIKLLPSYNTKPKQQLYK